MMGQGLAPQGIVFGPLLFGIKMMTIYATGMYSGVTRFIKNVQLGGRGSKKRPVGEAGGKNPLLPAPPLVFKMEQP